MNFSFSMQRFYTLKGISVQGKLLLNLYLSLDIHANGDQSTMRHVGCTIHNVTVSIRNNCEEFKWILGNLIGDGHSTPLRTKRQGELDFTSFYYVS